MWHLIHARRLDSDLEKARSVCAFSIFKHINNLTCAESIDVVLLIFYTDNATILKYLCPISMSLFIWLANSVSTCGDRRKCNDL